MIKLAKAPSLTERAYESIKRNILNRAFDSRDKLTEASLAAQLGISKSPVREALYRLETEGLVRIEARRGAHIRQFTAAEVRDIYDLREILEVHAVTVACVNPALLEQLHASVERTRRYLDAGEKLRHIEEDLKFHGLIAASTANSELYLVLQNIQQKSLLCRSMSYEIAASTAPHAHARIYEALRAGHRPEARDAMREHIAFVRDRLLSSIEGFVEI